MERIFDVYGKRIKEFDVYFVAYSERILLCHIKQYLDERYNDQIAKTIKNDKQLISYVEGKYFFDCLVYEEVNYFQKLF